MICVTCFLVFTFVVLCIVFQSHQFGLNDTCPGCQNQYSAGAVSNQLTVVIRKHIKQYYTVRKRPRKRKLL